VTLIFVERNGRLFSLSGFAHLSTEITNQWEFRLSLIFFGERHQSAIPLSES